MGSFERIPNIAKRTVEGPMKAIEKQIDAASHKEVTAPAQQALANIAALQL